MKGDNIMLNKEKYAKEIMDLALKHDTVALVDGKVCSCNGIIDCKKCFFNTTWSSDCDKKFIEWSNSEYKEPEIDWNKVPVDTPIYVWDDNDNRTYKRHFAGYDKVNNMIIAFDNGGTSWSSGATTIRWIHAKIKEGVDCSEWYKD